MQSIHLHSDKATRPNFAATAEKPCGGCSMPNKKLAVKELQTTTPCSNIGLIKVQYSSLNGESSLKSLASLLINPRIFKALQHTISICGRGSSELVSLKPRSITDSLARKISEPKIL